MISSFLAFFWTDRKPRSRYTFRRRTNDRAVSNLEARADEAAVAEEKVKGPGEMNGFDPMADAYFSSMNQYQVKCFSIRWYISELWVVAQFYILPNQKWISYSNLPLFQNRDGEDVPPEYCEDVIDKEREICPYYRETRFCIRGKTCPMLHLYTGRNSGTRAIDKVGTSNGKL